MRVRSLPKLLLTGCFLLLSMLLSGADFSIIDATGGGVLALRRAVFAFSRATGNTVSINRRDAAWGLEKLKAGDAAILILDAPELPADFIPATRMELATEALLLYVNAQNSLRQIKREAILPLLTGAAPTWETLTGSKAGVHRYRVKPGATGRETAEQLLGKPLPGGYFELGSLSELLLLAATDPEALVIGRYLDLYPDGMLPLAVDGIRPGLENLRSGRYPLSRKILLISTLPENDPKLLKFRSVLRERNFYDDLLEEGLLPSAALAK